MARVTKRALDAGAQRRAAGSDALRCARVRAARRLARCWESELAGQHARYAALLLAFGQRETPNNNFPLLLLDPSQHSSAGAKDRIAPPRLAPLPSPLLLLNRLLPLPLSRSVLCMSRCVRRFFCRILVPGEFASGELVSLGEALARTGAACEAGLARSAR